MGRVDHTAVSKTTALVVAADLVIEQVRCGPESPLQVLSLPTYATLNALII